jgi:CheY-like chemotaxis protein
MTAVVFSAPEEAEKSGRECKMAQFRDQPRQCRDGIAEHAAGESGKLSFESAGAGSVQETEPMKRRKEILVVDDDPSVRSMLKRVLAGEGYRVRFAANGETALQVADAAPPDLVLLDVKLSEESGWDIFGRLTRKWPLLPVVVITARPNQLFTALAAGVAALLEKPLHIPKMLQTISRLLRESVETRLARVAGKVAQFHYLPAWPEAQAICAEGSG